MIQKAVLAGCAEGPWVRVRDDYKEPTLHLSGPDGTQFYIETHKEFQHSVGDFCGPGIFAIESGVTFVRVRVQKGDPQSAMVLLKANRNAIQAA